MKGKTYRDKRGRTITVLGVDPLWPDGEKMLLQADDGKRWGCDTWRVRRALV